MASHNRRERDSDRDRNGYFTADPRLARADLNINYTALGQRFNNRHLRLPAQTPRIHNSYHSDEETTFKARTPPLPAPTPHTRRRTSFEEIRQFPSVHQVPSPPPVVVTERRQIRSPPRVSTREPRVSTARRVPSPSSFPDGGSYGFRVPSPPPQLSQRRRTHRDAARISSNRVPLASREPTPEELNEARRVGSNTRISDLHVVSTILPPRPPPPLESHTWSYGDFNVQRPRTPQPPSLRVEPDRLSPPNPLDYSSPGSADDRPGGLKRWSSERTPNPRASTPTHLTGLPLSNKRTTSLVPSESRLTLTSSGVLGDQAYQYTALQDFQFRLVKIFPERKTMIKCEIIHASLENPPRYVAVSYSWGDAGSTRKLELEGSLIPISVSLYGALEALRQKDDHILVWADALCIDQHNRDERTQQVGLMTNIYSTAESVAIWPGPEEDDSTLAIALLRSLADQADSPDQVSRLLSSSTGELGLAAVVSLFERDYWRRLWVVQEILNARSKTVYCGSSKVPWDVYKLASQTFSQHRADLERYLPGKRRDKRRQTISPNQFSDWQVLVYQGPGSLPDLSSYMEVREESLLEVLRACRRKIASDAKDKLFGILGILPVQIRDEFRADYSRSVKDVYTEVVDYLLKTTQCLDVICDAIHFPVHTDSANLPSYVPDWSHIPHTTAMGHKYSFSAAGKSNASCKFLDDRLNKLEISAVHLDIIGIHGIAVGTLCTLGDYLMAFLHWRALLLGYLGKEKNDYSFRVQEAFCQTLSLGQVPEAYNGPNQWLTVCYHVFASLLRERLPHLPLDQQLQDYVDARVDLKPETCRQFLQKHFGDQMMGRCFCRTEQGLIGMGSGAMSPGDVVVVPLGCSTPIILRPEGTRGEYRFVGDIYIHGYMDGRAIDEWKNDKRVVAKYVLH
jgi:hypothetical protein